MAERKQCSLVYAATSGDRRCPHNARFLVYVGDDAVFACGHHLTWAVAEVNHGNGVFVKSMEVAA